MDLSIIILNYKSRGLLRNCLRGFLSVNCQKSFEIIVVDNNSNEGVPEMIANEFPQARCIVSSDNIGFGPGNNLGIRMARGKYIAIVNPDTVFLENIFDGLVDFLEKNEKVGLVAPQLVNPDGTVQNSCYRFHSLLIPIYRRTALGKTRQGQKALNDFLMSEWDHNSLREVDWLLGAAIVVRKEVFDRIGLFDERFTLYFEDTDFCRRAWEAGWRVVYNPSIRLTHYHHRESADGSFILSLANRVTRIHIKSWIKYLWKYRGKILPQREDSISASRFAPAHSKNNDIIVRVSEHSERIENH